MTHPTAPTARAPSRPRLLPGVRMLLALAVLIAATIPLTATAVSSAPARAEVDFAVDDFEADEGSEEGEGNEEGEDEEWEFEGEGEEEEEGGIDPEASFLPPECLLRTAEATVTAKLGNGSLRLDLRYKAGAATRVGISYWLRGGKGSLRLGSATRRLNRHGVVHLNSRLDERGIAKARAARAFVVDLDVPAAPTSCDRFLTLHLNAKQAHGSRVTWSARRG